MCSAIPPNATPRPLICSRATAFAASRISPSGPLAHTASPPPACATNGMRGVASSSASMTSIASRAASFSLSAYARLGLGSESSDADDARDFRSAIGAGAAPVRSRRTRYTLGRMIVTEQLGMGGIASGLHRHVT